MRGPSVLAGAFSDAIAHVTDIAPTMYDLAGAPPQASPLFVGKTPPQGVSLLPVLRGEAASVRQSYGTHWLGNRGYRYEKWKISSTQPPLGTGTWQLFDLEADPGESLNVGGIKPNLLLEMLSEYEVYLDRRGVILPSAPPPKAGLRPLFLEPCDWWCELRFSVIDLLH